MEGGLRNSTSSLLSAGSPAALLNYFSILSSFENLIDHVRSLMPLGKTNFIVLGVSHRRIVKHRKLLRTPCDILKSKDELPASQPSAALRIEQHHVTN